GGLYRCQPRGGERNSLRCPREQSSGDGVGGCGPLHDRLITAVAQGEVKDRWGRRYRQGEGGSAGQAPSSAGHGDKGGAGGRGRRGGESEGRGTGRGTRCGGERGGSSDGLTRRRDASEVCGACEEGGVNG